MGIILKNTSKKRRVLMMIEHGKTALMALLIVSLIALIAVYISGMDLGAPSGADIGESFDRLWSVQSEKAPEGLDRSRLIPEFIGYRQAGGQGASAVLADANALSALYDITVPCILELFGSDSVCRELSREEGANLFALSCLGEEYVYIRYHTPVLYQLIYAYAADRLTVLEGDVASGEDGAIGAYISEIVIVADKDFAAHRFVAYAHDGNGSYYEFSQGSHVVSSDFYISKLVSGVQNMNTVSFYFAVGENFSVPEPIVSEEIETYPIVSNNSPLGDGERDALLSLFGYNLDKLSGYEDENGYVYIDTHSQLRLKDGYVSFVADDALGTSSTLRGIRIDSLLGYSSSAASGLFDKLTAADNLIRKLGEISPQLVGGGGGLCLGDVYSENGLLVIEYFPTFNGIRVGDAPCFKATLTDQTVCEVVVYMQALSGGESTNLALSAAYTLDTLFGVGDIPKDARISRVNLRYIDGTAKWNVILDK